MSIAFADAALARRIERGWARAAGTSALAVGAARPGAEVAVEPIGGGLAAFFGHGSPLSQAQGLGFDGPVSESELDALDAFFESRNTTASIEVASLADPGLLPALARRGYLVAEQTHMLAHPVEGFHPGSGIDFPGSVSRVRDDDPVARAACHEAVLRGFFEGPGEPPESIVDVMEALTAAPGTTVWLARLDDQAVAGATLLVQEGLALLAGDATIPAHRRRGTQAALIVARMAEAVRLGCDLAVACTQPGSGSQRNYERQGFRLIYARTLMNRSPR